MTDKKHFSEPIFFIGIAGMGMSSLAEIAHQHGISVFGSDPSSSPLASHLRSLGITVFDHHSPSNLQGCKTVVFSSAIPDSNPELIRAKELGLEVVHRSEFLCFLTQGRRLITVTGTHGKTTTTALVSHVLTACGVDPTCLVGGIVNEWSSTARHGSSDVWVVEADESDSSFMRYDPFISVITNIDLDHLDHYGSVENLHAAFKQYMGRCHEDGCNIVCWDDSTLRSFEAGDSQRIGYGFRLGADARVLDIQFEHGITKFRAVIEKQLVTARTSLVGKHNVLNCLAALCVARALELDIQKAADALATFSGVGRRFDRLINSETLVVIDDYAHNPGKIEALLTSIRECWPYHHLIAVFQPHRFSRLRTTFSETVNAFDSADTVVLLPVYAAGEDDDPILNHENICARYRRDSGVRLIGATDLEQAASTCASLIKENTMSVIVTVGAGDVWKVSHSIKKSETASS